MSARLKVAVVGLGVGMAHLEGFKALPKEFEIVAVCDVRAERAREVARQYGAPHACGDLAELLAMPDLDVIDLCTPPNLHVAQIRDVLASGKHAICEKPLAGSLREVDELIALEAASGRRVMPIFQYRFGHGLQKLKALRDAGVTGEAFLTTVETAWRRGADYYTVPWRGRWSTELGGALLSHAIHAHDLLSYVLGPVRSVFARVATRVNPIEVEDCAAASLEMADGSLATLAVTLGSPAEISRHRFCFRGLSAESHTAPYTSSADPWTFTPDTPEVARRVEDVLAGFTLLPEGYAGQFLRFHRALHGGVELPVTLADARASLELVTALYASARSGQAVTLPLGPDDPDYDGWAPRQVEEPRGVGDAVQAGQTRHQ